MSYSCTFAALSRVAKVCRRSWKWKSLIPDFLTACSKQTINWRRFLPVRCGSKTRSSSGESCRIRFRIRSAEVFAALG